MDDAVEEVETMYQLLKQYNVKMNVDDQTLRESLHDKEQDFTRRKLLDSKVFLDEQQQAMCEDCYSRSVEVEEKTRDVAA